MADYIELAAAAQILRQRADDLERIRNVLTNNAQVARWQCAKADRYRSAVDARSSDMVRLQQLMSELAQSVAITSSMMLVEHMAAQSSIGKI